MLKQLLADLADPNNFELDPRDLCVKFAAWHRSAVKLLAAVDVPTAEVTSAPPPVEHKKVWSPTVGITKEPRGWEKFK